MKKMMCLMLILIGIGMHAEWQAIDPQAQVDQEIQVKVLRFSAQEMQIEISIPGYHDEQVLAGETVCSNISIPGASVLMKKGYPTIPKLGKLLCVPDNCKVSMRVVSKVEVEKNITQRIIPSKGHLTRDINPKDVDFEFNEVYGQDSYWPTTQFSLGQCFQFRDISGVRLRVLPVRFNHVQNKMKILQKVVVAFEFKAKDSAKLRFKPISPSKVYDNLYRNTFLGYGNLPKQQIRESRKLLVVTPVEYTKTIQPWIEWKQKAGYEVTTHTTSNRDRSFEIKDDIQRLFDKSATRFDYVVLMGDAKYSAYFEDCQPMPTFEGSKEGAAADRVYVRLRGFDNYPDACISRISGDTPQDIAVQLEKIMQYEQNPAKGKWLKNGICVASDEGHFKDWQRAEWLQKGGSKSQNVPIENGGLLANGFDSFTDVYDPGANPAKITEALNRGSSIICYIGHGTPISWVSSGFNNDDIHQLSNSGLYPVIWSVACVNGKFVHLDECFAEAWLRKKDGGAVAVEAASTNESWIPPCDKQSATINSIINNSALTFGAQELAGCIRAMEIWGDDDDSEGNKMAEQCNLFGDCTLIPRYGKQSELQVHVDYQAGKAVFRVQSNERKVKNAIVTVYTSDFGYRVSHTTNDRGEVSVAAEKLLRGKLFYTVVAPNAIPIVDRLLR
ncbi:C25 family cysteine peptidase [Candidatus Uabimicrobium amorphum]|uniref:Gingipain domain-containing protein n=1 Tax=Uabimicrobium amorphum TaxID=2596890 RepID=A0A5S9IN51_UABAM|nr:C25 family cysteine peptidase [Candidatus Uabimicrobium amorphum]BBM84591.1 hypothetical protein UABAM_02952 [Candidatus Uabimicrobium amorphum]